MTRLKPVKNHDAWLRLARAAAASLMARALLRGAAIVIAVAGLIDPVSSLERPVQPALSIVVLSRHRLRPGRRPVRRQPRL